MFGFIRERKRFCDGSARPDARLGAAINLDDLAGDPGRDRGREVKRRGGDVLDFAQALQGVVSENGSQSTLSVR